MLDQPLPRAGGNVGRPILDQAMVQYAQQHVA